MRFRSIYVLLVVSESLLVACTGAFEAVTPDGADGSAVDASDDGFTLGRNEGGSDTAAPVEGGHADAAGHDATTDGGPGEAAPPEASGGCATGSILCNGACVPSDDTNCGTCGHSCNNLPNVSGATTCSPAGVCTFASTSCATGWADCDSKPDDGCETNITLPATCGSCTTACNSSDPVCAPSGGGYACATGCDGGALCSGSCVDTQSSPGNCNTCGNQCPSISGGQPTCNGGTCGVSCNGNLTACPTVSPTACVDTGSDLGNCGGCGIPCTTSVSEAYATCSGGQCGFACDTNFVKCDGACAPVADTTNGAFVVSGASGACTAASPCGSIGQALGTGKSIIYVAPGTYTEAVSVSSGVRISGGWTQGAGGWSNCDASGSGTTIAAPSGQSAAVTSTGSGVTLDTLTIHNSNTAGPSQSLYGVMATAGSLTLSGVSISVAGGGNGAGGGTGTAGTAASTKGCTLDNGQNGTPGSTGSAGQGSYSAAGYAPGTGGMGGTGNAGHNGATPPQPGQTGGPTTATGAECTGSSSTTCALDNGTDQSTGNVGDPGCPSGPSGGGTGGTGGGSSIGVFAWAAQVTIGGSIGTGAGGTGGAGAAGGTVSPGAIGPSGAPGFTFATSCGWTSVPPEPFGCHPVHTSAGGSGGLGSTGGMGGQGGPGGGGSGGDSYCYYSGGGAAVSSSASCSPGTAGAGGNSGSPNQGSAGTSAPHN